MNFNSKNKVHPLHHITIICILGTEEECIRQTMNSIPKTMHDEIQSCSFYFNKPHCFVCLLYQQKNTSKRNTSHKINEYKWHIHVDLKYYLPLNGAHINSAVIKLKIGKNTLYTQSQ